MTRTEEIGRYELKYVLPVSVKAEVLSLIEPHSLPDANARPLADGSLGYSVRSLYFDTPGLDDYFDRLAEHRVRNRIRVRTYGEPGEDHPVFVENKRKCQRWVVKQRTKICHAGTWMAADDPAPWLSLLERRELRSSYAACHFRHLVESKGRVPTSVVHYRRQVFIDKNQEVHARLTLDQRINAAPGSSADDLFSAPNTTLIPDEWMVMELKFCSEPPGWMRQICRSLQLHSVPVSKYGLSVATSIRSDHPHELRFLTPPPLRRNGQHGPGTAVHAS